MLSHYLRQDVHAVPSRGAHGCLYLGWHPLCGVPRIFWPSDRESSR